MGKPLAPNSNPTSSVDSSTDYSMIDSFILVLTEWLNDYGQKAETRQQQYIQAPVWSNEAMTLLKTIENLIGTKKQKKEKAENVMLIGPNTQPNEGKKGLNIWRNDFKIVSGYSTEAARKTQEKHQWKTTLFGSGTGGQG